MFCDGQRPYPARRLRSCWTGHARVGRRASPRSCSRSSRTGSSAAPSPRAASCRPSRRSGEQFGFSRTVIREGLKQLEERGLVRVEQGRGTTVQPRDSWNLLDPTVIRIALDLRHRHVPPRRPDHRAPVLEREMARAAAARLTEDELAALAENIERMKTTLRRLRAIPRPRPRLPRRRHEGIRKRGRPDDRAHHPYARRSHAAACLGGVACGAEADGRRRTARSTRRWPRATASRPASSSRRTSTPPGPRGSESKRSA